MKRTLSLIALVLSMSFPGGSAFALTLEEQADQLGVIERKELVSAYQYEGKQANSQYAVKSNKEDALIREDDEGNDAEIQGYDSLYEVLKK
jgi:hypothetical protein